jgi:hypothetical protein
LFISYNFLLIYFFLVIFENTYQKFSANCPDSRRRKPKRAAGQGKLGGIALNSIALGPSGRAKSTARTRRRLRAAISPYALQSGTWKASIFFRISRGYLRKEMR